MSSIHGLIFPASLYVIHGCHRLWSERATPPELDLNETIDWMSSLDDCHESPAHKLDYDGDEEGSVQLFAHFFRLEFGLLPCISIHTWVFFFFFAFLGRGNEDEENGDGGEDVAGGDEQDDQAFRPVWRHKSPEMNMQRDD